MYRKYRQHEFVMDDESYFTLSNTTLTGSNTYYSSDRRLTPTDISYWKKAKFEEKYFFGLWFRQKELVKFTLRRVNKPSTNTSTWKSVLKIDWCHSFENIIVEVSMYFGPTWRPHIMLTRSKTDFRKTTSP